MSIDPALIANLTAAAEAYYNGEAIMSDQDYDRSVAELRAADPNHPLLQQVGAAIPKHREEVKHGQHMGSQHHINGDDALAQLDAWALRRSGQVPPWFHWSFKMDGSSVSLIYMNGKLARAVTRGDGQTGMDITRNARQWQNVPQEIQTEQSHLFVRVEVILPLNVWKAQFFDPENPTNARNVGNGIICRDSDPDNANQHIVAYALDVSWPGFYPLKVTDKYTIMEGLGFKLPPSGAERGTEQIKDIFNQTIQARDNLNFLIDGLVVAVDDPAVAASTGHAGYTDNRPKWSVAVKFPTERVTTKLLGIEKSMGHTGAIIPTAIFEPVFVAGTTVSRALLSNYHLITDLGIGIGDTIELEKGGDIIPHITRVVEHVGEPIQAPQNCYVCGTPLVVDGRRHLCPNEGCDGKVFKRIDNWRKHVGIDGLGEATIEALLANRSIDCVRDLYQLTLECLEEVAGGNAPKIMAEIRRTSELTVDVFLDGLSIPQLGLSRIQKVGLTSLEDWLGISEAHLVKVLGSVGSTVHAALVARQDEIRDLACYVTVLPYEAAQATGAALEGQFFCFSTCRPTEDEKAQVVAEGGKVQSGVSKGTTILVVKDPTKRTAKIEKAESMGVKIIGYDHFKKTMEAFR